MPARLKVGRPGANGPFLYRFERYAPTPSRTMGCARRYGMISGEIMLPQ
jgi:hypothetical protein